MTKPATPAMLLFVIGSLLLINARILGGAAE